MAKKAKAKAKKKPAVKAGKRKAGAKAAKTPARAASTKSAANRGRRQSWLDPKGHTPLIDQYARQLGTFLDAMADGVIDNSEVKAQEGRVVKMMRDVERKLDDEQHAQVTRLLCELTAYDIMQMLHAMHAKRPQVRFRG